MRTKKSGRLYKRLLKKYFQEKLAISDILNDYRALEMRGAYAKNLLLDPILVKRQLRKDEKDYSEAPIKKYIKKVNFDCNLAYKKRKKWTQFNLFGVQEYEKNGEKFFILKNKEYSKRELQDFLDQLVFDKWMNFFAMLDVRNTNNDSYEKRMTILTNRMIDKMGKLFIKIKNG